MSVPNTPALTSDARDGRVPIGRDVAGSIRRAGRLVALASAVLPLLLIGGLKFTQFEVEALKPLIGGAPWLAWGFPAPVTQPSGGAHLASKRSEAPR